MNEKSHNYQFFFFARIKKFVKTIFSEIIIIIIIIFPSPLGQQYFGAREREHTNIFLCCPVCGYAVTK